MFKKFIPIMASFMILIAPAAASAHVVVTPAAANVGQELVFSISVPNEEQQAVTALTLDVPTGVSNVIPTTKDGWTIAVASSGSGDGATVRSITWSAGQILVGQRQDFTFGAQVPAKATELDWKAYQTYADGTTVHWDQKPAGSDDATGNAGPYSITKVSNDLAAPASLKTSSDMLPVILSLAAIVLAVGGLLFRKK